MGKIKVKDKSMNVFRCIFAAFAVAAGICLFLSTQKNNDRESARNLVGKIQVQKTHE